MVALITTTVQRSMTELRSAFREQAGVFVCFTCSTRWTSTPFTESRKQKYASLKLPVTIWPQHQVIEHKWGGHPHLKCFSQSSYRPSIKVWVCYRRNTAAGSSSCTSDIPVWYQYTINKTLWSESASELYRPSDRRLSAKWCQLLRI
jgi:hypothetical protein